MSEVDSAPVSKAVLQYVIETVVTNASGVSIDSYPDKESDAVFMEVSVGEGDMGRVIGKKGKMANTIRVIADAASISDDCVVEVEFLDS